MFFDNSDSSILNSVPLPCFPIYIVHLFRGAAPDEVARPHILGIDYTAVICQISVDAVETKTVDRAAVMVRLTGERVDRHRSSQPRFYSVERFGIRSVICLIPFDGESHLYQVEAIQSRLQKTKGFCIGARLRLRLRLRSKRSTGNIRQIRNSANGSRHGIGLTPRRAVGYSGSG